MQKSIGSFTNKNNYFKDNWNKSFFICGALILSSTIIQNFILKKPIEIMGS